MTTSTHWGQGAVFQPGTSQIHHKYMDKVPTSFPRSSCQLHSKFPLPVCLWFTDPVIFKDILNVPRVHYIRTTSRTPQVSVQCARPGHRDCHDFRSFFLFPWLSHRRPHVPQSDGHYFLSLFPSFPLSYLSNEHLILSHQKQGKVTCHSKEA